MNDEDSGKLLAPRTHLQRNEAEQSTSVTVTIPNALLEVENWRDLWNGIEPFLDRIYLTFEALWEERREQRNTK